MVNREQAAPVRVDEERNGRGGAVAIPAPVVGHHRQVKQQVAAAGTEEVDDGDQAAALEQRVVAADGNWLYLDRPLGAVAAGARAVLLEGCDHTLETCAQRFGNAVNFRGEPFLPGNDLLTRYGSPGA